MKESDALEASTEESRHASTVAETMDDQEQEKSTEAAEVEEVKSEWKPAEFKAVIFTIIRFA